MANACDSMEQQPSGVMYYLRNKLRTNTDKLTTLLSGKSLPEMSESSSIVVESTPKSARATPSSNPAATGSKKPYHSKLKELYNTSLNQASLFEEEQSSKSFDSIHSADSTSSEQTSPIRAIESPPNLGLSSSYILSSSRFNLRNE